MKFCNVFLLCIKCKVTARNPNLVVLPCLQKCDTWCNIAYVHEKAGHDYEEIKDAYIKALAYAEQSGRQQSVVGLQLKYYN